MSTSISNAFLFVLSFVNLVYSFLLQQWQYSLATRQIRCKNSYETYPHYNCPTFHLIRIIEKSPLLSTACPLIQLENRTKQV